MPVTLVNSDSIIADEGQVISVYDKSGLEGLVEALGGVRR